MIRVPFKVTKRKLRVWGLLSVEEAAALHAELCRLAGQHVTIDLAKLEDIDLAGVQLLLAAKRSWNGLRLIPPEHAGLQKLLQMVGLI